MMQKVRRGVADVATSRKRVQLQVTQLELSAGKLQDQVQQTLAAGREDLAREALIRRDGAFIPALGRRRIPLPDYDPCISCATHFLDLTVDRV